jgi:hypothetical protein
MCIVSDDPKGAVVARFSGRLLLEDPPFDRIERQQKPRRTPGLARPSGVRRKFLLLTCGFE